MTDRKQLAQQLKDLRTEWKAWKRADYRVLSHIDYCLAPCPARCGNCEGCASTAYRQQHMDQVAAQAADVQRQLDAFAAPAATKPEQLVLLP